MTATTHYPQALSVLNQEEESFRIDTEAFKSVLNKAGNVPICILSINGPTRTGKSYLLDHFVRYFESKKRNPNCSDWYKQETSGTFGWRSGVERMTVGINLWSEPYFVNTPDGGKLAVLLMDTQGLFDKETTLKQNAIIFSISTLCSSVMMFNIMRLVDDNILQQIGYFSGYAHIASAYQTESQIKKNVHGNTNFVKGTKLFFLIRDFALPEREFMCGNHSEYEKPQDSNENYFTAVFEPKGKCPEENQLVRHNIRKNFSDISIYCLPHPGKAFEKGRDSEPDEEFQEYVIEFVEKIVRVENLVKKTVLGQPTTGLEFQEYIDTWADLCANSKDMFPDVVSVADSTAYTQYSMAIDIAMSKYKKDMDEFVNTKRELESSSELQDAHENFSQAAQEMFNNYSKVDHPRYERQYGQRMKESMEHWFEIAKKNIEVFKHVAAKAAENKELHDKLIQEMHNEMNNEKARMDAMVRGFKESSNEIARRNEVLNARLEATIRGNAIRTEAAEQQRLSLEKQIKEMKLEREKDEASNMKAEFNTPTPSSSAKWIPCSNGFLPNNAIQCGTEKKYFFYAARAYINGALTPGKFHSPQMKCYVSWGGKEYCISHYEILTAKPGELGWSSASDGQVVSHAVVGGISERGEQLFIGRAWHRGSLTPGKIQPSHKCCYIPFLGDEIKCSSYEILHA